MTPCVPFSDTRRPMTRCGTARPPRAARGAAAASCEFSLASSTCGSSPRASQRLVSDTEAPPPLSSMDFESKDCTKSPPDQV